MSQIDSSRPYIIKVQNVFSESECRSLIDRMEQAGLSKATVNTLHGARVNTDVRNNERVIFDDHELAQLFFDRIQHRAPKDIHGMNLIGANERIRCYRYQPGMRFAPHVDFPFARNDQEQSWYSYLIYLNDDFEGGNTTFFTQPEVAIRPERGMGLLFQHDILHEGSVVTSGIKYVARSDLMYRSRVEQE